MKRSTLRAIKTNGWESFIEWAVANDVSPMDLLSNPSKLTKVKSHLAVLKIARDIEKTMYGSNNLDTEIVMSNLTTIIGEE